MHLPWAGHGKIWQGGGLFLIKDGEKWRKVEAGRGVLGFSGCARALCSQVRIICTHITKWLNLDIVCHTSYKWRLYHVFIVYKDTAC